MATETISSNDHLENFDQEVQNLEITDNTLESAIENEEQVPQVPQVPQFQEELVPVDENPDDDDEETVQAAPQLRFDQVYSKMCQTVKFHPGGMFFHFLIKKIVILFEIFTIMKYNKCEEK